MTQIRFIVNLLNTNVKYHYRYRTSFIWNPILIICWSVLSFMNRYFAIVTVLDHLKIRKSRTTLVLAMIWLFSILIASPLLFQARASPFKYGDETLYDCREVWEGELSAKIYSGFVFALTFFIPFAALSFLYGSIGITLARHRTPGDECTENQVLTHKKFKVFTYLLLFYVFTYTVISVKLASDRDRNLGDLQLKNLQL